MSDNRLPLYQQLCTSYHAIDSFRTTLLGFLPLASGIGIFMLIGDTLADENKSTMTSKFFLPIGLFGFAITMGLFVFEIYGIRKCHALIIGGKQLEDALFSDGQFSLRPRAVAGFINEPLAAGIIYPAVLGAWTYLALHAVLSGYSWLVAMFVFLAGFAAMLAYNMQLRAAKEPTDIKLLNQRMLQAEENGDIEVLDRHLHSDFNIIRASGEQQERQVFLDAVHKHTNRGRMADRVEVHQYGDQAVYTCRVTTTRDQDGKETIGHFWNTRLFLRRDGEWRCVAWQVMRMPG